MLPVDLTPKLVTAMSEGYRRDQLQADAIAGLTVAIVALPLSMAIAIASGVPPERGLYAAIVGGFIISALGGSRYQIGGPAGAFIVLLAMIVERHGFDGLAVATISAGFMMVFIGLLGLGRYVRLIPYPVVVGFTCGIAGIIFASQIRELCGLSLANEPAALGPKVLALLSVASTVNLQAVTMSLLSIGLIVCIGRYRPSWPRLLIAVVVTSAISAALGLDIATIGSRFGGISTASPMLSVPDITPARVLQLLPDAASIALLGSIESLLSAIVADNLSGRRHRSNAELVAQGAANIVTPLMGGITVTGTIARTATNLRAGARTPMAGIFHAAFLFAFVVIAAPLARHIPLAALAGVLTVVAWNMAELDEARKLATASAGDAATVATTFGLTIFADLTIAIVVGIAMGALIVLGRLGNATEIASSARAGSGRAPVLLDEVRPGPRPDDVVCRLRGALFFGSAERLGRALDELSGKSGRVVLEMTEVTLVDSSAAATILNFAERCRLHGATVAIRGAPAPVRRRLIRAGLKRPHVRYISQGAAEQPIAAK